MINQFNDQGYLILKNFFDINSDLNPFYQELSKLGNFVKPNFDPFDKYTDDSLSDKQRSNFYKILRYLPCLKKLSTNDKTLKLCKELGLKFPVVMNSCNIRMDFPRGDDFLFHWHQDITYLLGSMNALTFWIPLTVVNETNGTIEVVPGSHKSGVHGINYVSNKKLDVNSIMSPKDIRLKDTPSKDIVHVNAKPGDLVVFSQLLLHRSTPNYCDKIRWAIQLRYSDAMNEQFYDDNYPFGDSTNIFQTNYL